MGRVVKDERKEMEECKLRQRVMKDGRMSYNKWGRMEDGERMKVTTRRSDGRQNKLRTGGDGRKLAKEEIK